jgi:AcrR family transcriptional regulator
MAAVRGGRAAGVGSRSDKVRLRRRPIRRSSRFVCEAILEAFEKALESLPFESCTTNHIADLAGVGIGSFYEYFSNKETVLAVWLHRHSARVLTDFDQLLDQAPNAKLSHQVDDIVKGVFECYARKQRVWQRIAHAVYAVSTDEQCERCARDFAGRWQRLLGAHYPAHPGGPGRLATTARACHEQLLAHIEETLLGHAADLTCPLLRQRCIDALLNMLDHALGLPAR